MKIKNYTSGMPVDRIISKIERTLVSYGAVDILKNYKDNILKGISFQIRYQDRLIPIKLPAKIDSTFNVLWKEVKKPRPETKERIKQQAEKTAWKVICDWIEVQFTMVRLEQAEITEIFLPYMWIPKLNQTFYDKLKNDNFKLLTSGNKKDA